MGEQWLSFKKEAWIVNWTESGPWPLADNGSPVGYKSSDDRTTTSSRALDDGPSLLECVLFSVFGTLVGLFLIFQLVLYIRFCITGHHDWKWSLPYLLRLRRVECMRRQRGKPEGAGGGGDGGNAESAEPITGDGRWDNGAGGATVWAHVYPGERAGTALPCRRGFFFTTRSLSSYFRSIAASMLPNGGSSATGGTPTSAPQVEAATCEEGSAGGGTESTLKPIPAAVFLVDPRNPESHLERAASIGLPASRSRSRWRRPCDLISGGRWSAPAAAVTGPQQHQGDMVLFHCENPGYESDASMAFTHTDDEGAATDPGGADVTVGRGDLVSDESLTSISSLSLSSVSRLQAGMASLIARRTNSARSRTSQASCKRLSSSEQAGETKRVKFRTHSRSNSTSSATLGGGNNRGQYANNSDGSSQVTTGSSSIGPVASTNDLNKASFSREKLTREQVLGTRLDTQGASAQNIKISSLSNGSVALDTNLDIGSYGQKLNDGKDIKGKKIVVESSCEGNSPDSNSS